MWSAGYAASASKWGRVQGWFTNDRDAGHGMALPDRALQMLDLMGQQGIGQRPLFFICHSLGGLLAKQILRKSADSPRAQSFFQNTRAVMFLATPHAGSSLASLADSFRDVFGPTVTLQGLQAHDAHLSDLYDWYRNHADAASIETATYYEQRSWNGATIVNRTSARCGAGRDAVPQDEDHLSIAKPREKIAQVCLAASELLQKYVLAERALAAVASPAGPAPPIAVTVHVDRDSRPHRRIPRELPPAAEQFFGRTPELAALTGRLRETRNTAVVGPAGMGKTALAAEALRTVVGSAMGPFPDGIVFLDLYRLHGMAEAVWNALANRIEGIEFLKDRPARERADEACRARRLLVIFEGGEEADGQNGRAAIHELLEALAQENRWLLLTRLGTQAHRFKVVDLRTALDPEDAARLLRTMTGSGLGPGIERRTLDLLEGHPLALTWAGGLLARGDEDPETLLIEWTARACPRSAIPPPRLIPWNGFSGAVPAAWMRRPG